ncbi:hypothetical protein FH609_002555 [Streptomyces sp. 3MP-14]|uniref:Uncharacterized protein n=1 Tax=Streptomyces mimosae TaxID=2586635 RepID=A0A5N6ACA3_9ACTN|nr:MULTISPECIES: hypothetical protein [Streptomyces]KAB8166444.1 hypothetical protein FH607_011505 [Streptomyces mimosae]KAB8178873.1 hypothetical protein FH609_002555 [Streptomyces sp. 3MP-14]
MIPIDVSVRRRAQFVRNIIGVWHSATIEQEHQGRLWYRTAHDLAASFTGGDARVGAGVIAALSANKSWEHNVELARTACGSGLSGGHVADALMKVSAILAGADPESVLPMERKTGHFFRRIADPDAVVIDRHAHDVAVGHTYGARERGLSSARRYDLLANCYRRAALRLGELPSTVQAVTWVVHTSRVAGTGTRRPAPLAWRMAAPHRAGMAPAA